MGQRRNLVRWNEGGETRGLRLSLGHGGPLEPLLGVRNETFSTLVCVAVFGLDLASVGSATVNRD